MKRISFFFLILIPFCLLASASAGQSIAEYKRTYIDLQKRYPDPQFRVEAAAEEKAFDKSDLGRVFTFIANSEVHGITSSLTFPEIHDDTWTSIKYEDENLYYGLQGLSIIYSEASLKDRLEKLIVFREGIPRHIQSDVVYALTAKIITSLFYLNGISPALIELMLVMDSLSDEDPNKIFQYSKADSFNTAFDIYFELSDFKAARKYCNRYIENTSFLTHSKYVHCNALLANHENSEDYLEQAFENTTSPLEKAKIVGSKVWRDLHHNNVDSETLKNIDLVIATWESQTIKNREQLVSSYIKKTYVLAMLNEFSGAHEAIEKAHGYNTPSIGYERLINMAEIALLKAEGKLDDALALSRETLFDFFYAEPVMSAGERTVLSATLDKVLNFSDYESMQRKNREQSLLIENQNLTRTLLVISLFLSLAVLLLTYQGYRSFKRRAQYDGLTGIYNRSTGIERLNSVYTNARRGTDSLVLALVDLDDFKLINDNFGHSAGDEVLKVFAKIAQDSIRSSDILMRYGGEEFLFVFVDMTPQMVSDKLEDIRKSLKEHKDWKTVETEFNVSFSAGISSAPNAGEIQEAINRADESLYRAKAQGKSKSCIAG